MLDNLESVACPLCGGSQSALWAEENGYNAVKCAGCGLVFVNPRPRLSEISVAHQSGEHRTANQALQVTTRFAPQAVTRFKALLRTLFPDRLRQRPSWLDIGAGNGELLAAVRESMGPDCRLLGIEPNRHKRQHAAERGISLIDTDVRQLSARFDVISLINVFSHLPEPVEFLRGLEKQLEPRGSLFLVTGNGGDLTHRKHYPGALDLPDHLTFIGKEQLVRLMATLGYQLRQLEESRFDTPGRIVMHLVRRRWSWGNLRIPYTSPFRSVAYRFDRCP
jgi:2-polyprenyl-3-methyl-5-hydroxy-6-metoxy-1,4-benzoquinol methylase